MQIIEILRLWEQGYSQRKIAVSINCSKSTVVEIQQRCTEAGLSYETTREKSDDEINKLVYPSCQGGRPVKHDPDWAEIQRRLDTSKRLNLMYLWEEYKETVKDGLGRSQFYERYATWKAAIGKDVVMAQSREPGKELFVDWMGDTLPCVLDTATGKTIKAHFFVSTLGDSGYPSVFAYPNEKKESWIDAHVKTFNRLGGLPLISIPDNCKTAVTKSNYYDPVFNKTYYDMSLYYNIAIIPARIKEPRDKSLVEGSIGWLETWLLEWLRGRSYNSFAELNAAIKLRIKELEKRPFQKRAGSRQSVFLEIDRPALRPLPQHSYETPIYVERKVPNDYHVEYEKFYYSVPYRYYKQKVTIKATYSAIEVSNRRFALDRLTRVAIHERRYSGLRHVTEKNHMPPHHQARHEAKGFDGKRYRSWASSIGVNTFFALDSMLKEREIEQTAYRSCMGVLQFSRKYGNARLEMACSKARRLGSISYNVICNILKNNQENIPLLFELEQTVTPVHENLRGQTAFM
jgi:transposase